MFYMFGFFFIFASEKKSLFSDDFGGGGALGSAAPTEASARPEGWSAWSEPGAEISAAQNVKKSRKNDDFFEVSE